MSIRDCFLRFKYATENQADVERKMGINAGCKSKIQTFRSIDYFEIGNLTQQARHQIMVFQNCGLINSKFHVVLEVRGKYKNFAL